MKIKKINKKRITINIPEELYNRIEKERGYISRSGFITQFFIKYLGKENVK